MSNSKSQLKVESEDIPKVTVIIPIRNEEGYIGECLDSILDNDYPEEKLEILVVDGESTDDSREIVQQYAEREGPEIRILDNPERFVPQAMNTGIDAATGDLIARVDGHSFVAKDFISTSVETLLKIDEADAVGGPVRPVFDDNTPYFQRVIARALDSPLASGSARFSGKSGYVTTVSFGTYRAEVFEECGNFDERFVRTQDYELNYRLNRYGGKIFMNPEIKSYYYPRNSLSDLWSQYFQFGFWKTKVMKKYGELLSAGNLVPSLFVVGVVLLALLGIFFPPARYALFASLAGYFAATTYFGFREIKNTDEIMDLPGVVLGFITIHFGFGLGSLKGIFFDLNGRLTLPWRGLSDD